MSNSWNSVFDRYLGQKYATKVARERTVDLDRGSKSDYIVSSSPSATPLRAASGLRKKVRPKMVRAVQG